jgi:hypothetical protein
MGRGARRSHAVPRAADDRGHDRHIASVLAQSGYCRAIYPFEDSTGAIGLRITRRSSSCFIKMRPTPISVTSRRFKAKHRSCHRVAPIAPPRWTDLSARTARSFPYDDVLAAATPLRGASVVFSSCARIRVLGADRVDGTVCVGPNMARVAVDTRVAHLRNCSGNAGVRRYGTEACVQEELVRNDSENHRIARNLCGRFGHHDSRRIDLRAAESLSGAEQSFVATLTHCAEMLESPISIGQNPRAQSMLA